MEATIPTRRRQADTAKARLRKPRPGEQKQEKRNVSQSSCFPKSEGRHHRWNGKNGLKKERHDRDDSAYDQARKEPVLSHNLQENSQARFFPLDTTAVRRNQPEKRWSVLRQAPRGQRKRRPAQAHRNHHAKESLEEARSDQKEIPANAQGIKGTRVAAARPSRRRGGQATTQTRARPIRSSGRPQSPARRPERRAATRRSGLEHAEVPPIKERPAVVGRNPA